MEEKPASEFIPASIRALMRHEWQHDPKYSAFETSTKRGDSLNDPSYYHFRRGDSPDGVRTFSFDEVVALARHGFANTDGDHASMNEHVAHAISDFLGEVSEAWKQCRDRIKRLP